MGLEKVLASSIPFFIRSLAPFKPKERNDDPAAFSRSAKSILLSSRSLLLRSAGYAVDEAYTVDKAISLVEADSIDAVLICHTVPRGDQQVIIAAVREKRRLSPLLIRADSARSALKWCSQRRRMISRN
jgi:hypothetical protein